MHRSTLDKHARAGKLDGGTRLVVSRAAARRWMLPNERPES